jgi:hypothetical protein
VVIDFAVAFSKGAPPNIIEPPSLGLLPPTKSDPRELDERYQDWNAAWKCLIFDDFEFDTRRLEALLSSTSLYTVLADEGNLSEEMQMLLPYFVYGYVLLNRKWCKQSEAASPESFDMLIPS